MRLRGVGAIVGGAASDRRGRGGRAPRLGLGGQSQVSTGTPAPLRAASQGAASAQALPAAPSRPRGPGLAHARSHRVVAPRETETTRGGYVCLRLSSRSELTERPARQLPLPQVLGPDSHPLTSFPHPAVLPHRPSQASCPASQLSLPQGCKDRPTSHCLGPLESGYPRCTHLSVMLTLRPGATGGRKGARDSARVREGASAVTL